MKSLALISATVALLTAVASGGVSTAAARDWPPYPHAGERGVPERRPVAASCRASVEIFVAPDGDDGADGTEAHPLRTWSAAARRVRALLAKGTKGGITVRFRGGEYPVAETVRLGKADSGTEACPVVYAAARGEAPIFTGGFDLPAPQRVTSAEALGRLPSDAARENVRVFDLTRAGYPHVEPHPPIGSIVGWWGKPRPPITDLYENGVWRPVARFPNEGFLHATNIVDCTNYVFKADVAAGDAAVWAKEPELMACGYWIWCYCDYTLPIRIDAKTGVCRLPDHSTCDPMMAAWNPEMNYFLLNALAALDRPGEWYLDSREGLLYFWPAEETPWWKFWTKPRYTLSSFGGAFLELKDVSHVRVSGLSFRYGRGPAIVADKCRDVTFDRCEVRGFGGRGLHLDHAQDCTVWGNVFRDFGAGALEITGGDRKALKASGIRFENNEVAWCGRRVRTYTPGLWLNGCGTEVVYNHFHDQPSSAFRLEGNDYLLSMNRVEDVLLESGDQGAVDIFNNPSYLGNVYSYNLWRRIGRGGHGQAGIRFDDLISCQLVYGNRFDAASDGKHFGGVQVNGGRRNRIDNNVFTRCPIAVSGASRDPKRWQEELARPEMVHKLTQTVNLSAPPYTVKYPEARHLVADANPTNFVTRNIIVGAEKLVRTWRDDTFLLAGNWTPDTLPDLDRFAAEHDFDPLPPESAIGTYPISKE